MWGDPYKGQLGQYPEGKHWDHTERALYGTPILIKTAEPIKQVMNGGFHSAILSVSGRVYTFGCGSDGRLGQPGFEGHRYLYKESQPKLNESIDNVIELQSSYYHTMALV